MMKTLHANHMSLPTVANSYAKNGAPRRFFMRHLDFFSENVAKSRPR